jgi:cysteine desulfurase
MSALGPDPSDIVASAPHILSLSIPPIAGETLLHALESEGVYVSTGAACSSKKTLTSPVLAAMGVPLNLAKSALRFSLSPFTSDAEIEYAAEVLGRKLRELTPNRARKL